MVVLKALHNSSGSRKALRPPPPKIPNQPVHKLLSYPLILGLATIQPRLGWYHSSGFMLQLQGCDDKPLVSIEELSTPVDPAVLDHSPATINEQMVNLFCHTTLIGIPSPTMSL